MEEIKIRKPLVAFFLSFMSPGLGQVYNGELKKAIVLDLLIFLVTAVLLSTHLFLTFRGLFTCLLVLAGSYLLVPLEAWHRARQVRQIALKPYNKWHFYMAMFFMSNFALQPLASSVIQDHFLSTKAYRIVSETMEPSLRPEDHLVANMEYYISNKPQRGDVILFSYPKDPAVDIIQRVIALEGEKVEIRKNAVYINDRLMEDPWGHYEMGTTDLPSTPQVEDYGPMVVPGSSVFVLGDHRRMSQDSRHFGFVVKARIKGKALYIYWSKDRDRIGLEIR
jgi:signal peptidase I